MVRLIPVERAGKIVWIEDAPDCPAGHDALPKWGPCPACGFSIRYWRCAVNCGQPDQWDYGHRCEAGTLPA